MYSTRQNLHTLVDMVEETEIDTLYKVMIKFIAEDDALPDEIVAYNNAMQANDELVSHDDINWT